MPTLIIPEVFADAVNARLDSALRIGRIAFDATAAVPEVMQYGDTVHFPQLKRVVTASEVTKGTAIEPAAVDMQDTSATVKQVAGAARVYDAEAAQIKGLVMDNMILQVAEAMATKIEADLVDAMDEDIVYKSATAAANAITADELMAAFGLFGDDVDTDRFAGIVINSRLLPSFLNMEAFTSIEKTYNKAEQGNGLIVDGVVGYFIGIPVIVCNNGTYDATASECKTYIVKRDALGYVFQRNINVEEERESKLLATDIIASSLYAVKLLDTAGAVVVRKTTGEAGGGGEEGGGGEGGGEEEDDVTP